MTTSGLKRNEPLDRSQINSIIEPCGAPPIVVRPGWDVVLEIRKCDDRAEAYLNDRLIVAMSLRDSPVRVSLQKGLVPGQNILRIRAIDDNPGGVNWWGINYALGVYDANNQPQDELIEINLSGRSWQAGVKFEVEYELQRT